MRTFVKTLFLFAVLLLSLASYGQSKYLKVKVGKPGTGQGGTTPPADTSETADYIAFGQTADYSFFTLTDTAYVGWTIEDTTTGDVLKHYIAQEYFPGTYPLTWDQYTNDTVFVSDISNLKFNVISHKFKKTWEGKSLNTSTQFSNTAKQGNKIFGGYYGAAIDVYTHPTSGWNYYTTGYAEHNLTFKKFHDDSTGVNVYLKRGPGYLYADTAGAGGGGYGHVYNITGDANYVYVSAMTHMAQASNVPENFIWIMAFDANPASPNFDMLKNWSAGTSVNPTRNYYYPSAIVLHGFLGRRVVPWALMVTGLAVNDNYLFVAQGKNNATTSLRDVDTNGDGVVNTSDTSTIYHTISPNKIKVFDKITGAPVDSIPSGVITRPRRMAASNSHLWVIYGEPGSVAVGKFALTGSSINTTPLLTLPGLSDPLSMSIQTVGGTEYIYVCDGGTSQVLRRYRTSDGQPDNTFNNGQPYFGTLGGYANITSPTNAIVTDSKFFFKTSQDKNPGISVRPDGSFWLADIGNNRIHKYAPNLTRTHRIEFQGATYGLFAPKDSTRLFLEFREYEVNYNVPPSEGWSLKRQFEPSAYAYGWNPHGPGENVPKWFNWMTTLPNGKIYAAIKEQDPSQIVHIVEVTDYGFRDCYTIAASTGGRESGKFDMLPTGDMVYSNYGSTTIFYRIPLTGYNTVTWNGQSWQNPTWNLTSTAFEIARYNPGPNTVTSVYKGAFSNGNLFLFDGARPSNNADLNHRRAHVGVIRAGQNNSFLAKSFYSTYRNDDNGGNNINNYRGDYPLDGRFDIGNGVTWPADATAVKDDFAVFTYRGEFWKAAQTGMNHLLYKNGLELFKYGVAINDNPGGKATKGYPEWGGNTITILLNKIGNSLYQWQGEEGYHNGPMRWRIDYINTLKDFRVPLKPYVQPN